MQRFDVVIAGAGPAGSTVALNLAPLCRVALVEARQDTPLRIGESLPPPARRLLGDMGILDSFVAEAHLPYHGNRSSWGSSQWIETDFLNDPDGPGWHLDRSRFEAWLRRTAVERGSVLFAPVRLKAIERGGDRWKVLLATESGSLSLSASVVVDATGRAANLGRRLGARRHTWDRLICSWICARAKEATNRGAGFTHIQASEDGWWYAAPIPGGRRIVGFHTDSDLPAAHPATRPAALLANAPASGEFGEILGQLISPDCAQHGVTSAGSSVLQPCAGPAWFAVGDAAITFDPLSGQGLLNALFTGLAAAEAADRQLRGCSDALPGYLQTVAGIETAYRRHLHSWYQQEPRWPHAPFWQRRHSAECKLAS